MSGALDLSQINRVAVVTGRGNSLQCLTAISVQSQRRLGKGNDCAKNLSSQSRLPGGRHNEQGMTMFKMAKVTLAAAALGAMAMAGPASAGNYNGDFLVRLQGTYVDFKDDSSAVGTLPGALDLDNEVIPTATLTYFLTKNIGVELFCCFAKLQANHNTLGEVADFWVFPPALTLQYHFDPMGGVKPYVGAGIQYILPFSEEGTGALAGQQVKVDDALGFTLQAGVDIEVGQGWYLNADVKKTWIEHTVSVNGVDQFDLGIDPWVFSVGLGYRFNLSDIFGSRAEAASLK